MIEEIRENGEALGQLPGQAPVKTNIPPSVFQPLNSNNVQNLPPATVSAAQLSNVLEWTSQLNFQMESDRNTISSSGLPLEEKRIRNVGKRKVVSNFAEIPVTIQPNQNRTFRGSSSSATEGKMPYQVHGMVPQMQAMNPLNVQKGVQKAVEQRPPDNRVLHESKVSDDNEVAPQCLPGDDFEENTVQPVVHGKPSTATSEQEKQSPFTVGNQDHPSSKELKASDVSDMSQFNMHSIASGLPPNLFSSNATLANFGSVPPNFPAAIVQTTLNIGNKNANEQKATQSVFGTSSNNVSPVNNGVNNGANIVNNAYNQQYPQQIQNANSNNAYQKSHLNVYGNAQQTQPYSQYLQYPGLSDLNPGSFTGFPSITSAVPAIFSSNAVDKSKYLNQPAMLPQNAMQHAHMQNYASQYYAPKQ